MLRFSWFYFKPPYCNPIRWYQGPATPSILSEGTPIKGVNILKEGQDPIAKKDEDYPTWLWTCHALPKKEFTEEEKETKTYLRYLRKQKIKENNFSRSQW